jgi:hypothetical protein
VKKQIIVTIGKLHGTPRTFLWSRGEKRKVNVLLGGVEKKEYGHEFQKHYSKATLNFNERNYCFTPINMAQLKYNFLHYYYCY